MNICRNCVYWQFCMRYRYHNVQKEFMVKVNRRPNSDGDLVIYVEECKRFIKFKPFKGKIFK